MTSCKDIVDVCTLYIVHSNCQQCEYYRNCWEPYDHHMMIHTGEATLLCNIELYFFCEQSDLMNIVWLVRCVRLMIEKFFEIWIEFFCVTCEKEMLCSKSIFFSFFCDLSWVSNTHLLLLYMFQVCGAMHML